jgi:hypothetical protein
MSHLINLEIAGVNFSINCRDSMIPQDFEPAYKSFLKAARNLASIDININLELNNIPDIKRLKNIFDSGQSWSMFQKDNDYYVISQSPASKNPIWISKCNRDFTKITVFCNKNFFLDKKNTLSILNPVRYPLDQIILMHYLALRKGTIIHAAGVVINQNGYIFPGRSGSGKSTLSKQFIKQKYIQLLSDDRIVVRKINNTLKAYGTPWPGEEGIAINKSVPLSGIFFITHAGYNRIEEIKPQKALEKLLPVVSIPWYDKKIMTKILDFCDDLISYVPAYELYFKPDNEVVNVFEKFVTK